MVLSCARFRWKNPTKWFADRMAAAAAEQAMRNDPEWLKKRKESRSLKAKRAYAVRRLNGNSGKGRPRRNVDHAKALAKAAKLAAERAAMIKAGLATEADFIEPPKKPKVRGIPKKDIPTVKNRRGKPRKLLTPEEKAALAFKAANGPRPRGRPRKLPVATKPPTPVSTNTVAISLSNAAKKWMAAAAARAASEFPGVPPMAYQVEYLAISKTKELTGAQAPEWTPQMTAIAADAVEAWWLAWDEGSLAARKDRGDEALPPTDGDQAAARAKGGVPVGTVGTSRTVENATAVVGDAAATLATVTVVPETPPEKSPLPQRRLSSNVPKTDRANLLAVSLSGDVPAAPHRSGGPRRKMLGGGEEVEAVVTLPETAGATLEDESTAGAIAGGNDGGSSRDCGGGAVSSLSRHRIKSASDTGKSPDAGATRTPTGAGSNDAAVEDDGNGWQKSHLSVSLTKATEVTEVPKSAVAVSGGGGGTGDDVAASPVRRRRGRPRKNI